MLRITDITRRFEQPTGEPYEVLRGVSLMASPGDIVAIMGPNGCGKTTLLNIVSGDLEPNSGHIELDGRDILRMRAHRRCHVIGRVHQESYKALAAELTVGEVLSLASKRQSFLSLTFPHSAAAVCTLSALSPHVGNFLKEKLHIIADTLSGGQRQLLALAVAVLGYPKVILLDEHRASLDGQYQNTADDLLHAYVKAEHASVLVATHDHAWARGNCSHVARFDAGTLVVERMSPVEKEGSHA